MMIGRLLDPCSDHYERDRPPPGWERDVFEAVVRSVWPLLMDGLEPEEGGWYRAADALPRVPAAVAELADRTPEETLDAFLAAVGRPVEEDAVGPIHPACECAYCRTARRRAARPVRGHDPAGDGGADDAAVLADLNGEKPLGQGREKPLVRRRWISGSDQGTGWF